MNWTTNITIESNIEHIWSIINLNNSETRNILLPKIKNYTLNFQIKDTKDEQFVNNIEDKQVLINRVKDEQYLKNIEFSYKDKLNNNITSCIYLIAQGNQTELKYEGEIEIYDSLKNKLFTNQKKINDEAIEFCLQIQELAE